MRRASIRDDCYLPLCCQLSSEGLHPDGKAICCAMELGRNHEIICLSKCVDSMIVLDAEAFSTPCNTTRALSLSPSIRERRFWWWVCGPINSVLVSLGINALLAMCNKMCRDLLAEPHVVEAIHVCCCQLGLTLWQLWWGMRCTTSISHHYQTTWYSRCSMSRSEELSMFSWFPSFFFESTKYAVEKWGCNKPGTWNSCGSHQAQHQSHKLISGTYYSVSLITTIISLISSYSFILSDWGTHVSCARCRSSAFYVLLETELIVLLWKEIVDLIVGSQKLHVRRTCFLHGNCIAGDRSPFSTCLLVLLLCRDNLIRRAHVWPWSTVQLPLHQNKPLRGGVGSP